MKEEISSYQQSENASGPMREMTVREYLDREIHKLQRRIDGLRDLRRSLAEGYLEHGCSLLAEALRLGERP